MSAASRPEQWLSVGMADSTEIKSEEDLLPPGAPIGTVPTDLEQATGLERLEIIGKMQSVDIFDMKPLDASRKGAFDLHIRVERGRRRCGFGSGRAGRFTDSLLTSIPGTLDNPIIVRSFGDEQYAGCTGYPADSHVTIWLTVCLNLMDCTSPQVRADCFLTDVSQPTCRALPRMRKRTKDAIRRPATRCS